MYNVRIVNNDQDLQNCFAIRNEVFVVEQNVPVSDEWDGRDAECIHFLAVADEDGAPPLGTARLCERADGTGKIQRVAVRAASRKSGVGRLLMDAVEREAARRGIGTVCLAAQTASIDFYARLGYHAFGDVFDDAGIPHRNMEKKLGVSND